MSSPEVRPLRKPKLGIPGFYPQGEKQREVSQALAVGMYIRNLSMSMAYPQSFLAT